MVKIMEIFLMILKKKGKKYPSVMAKILVQTNTLFNILQNKTKRTEESKQIAENN